MQSRSRRIRALVAAGMVLGIGSATTLAAWNDSEYAQGTITAATFTLESSGGSGFASSSAENPRTLTYSTPATAMFPGQNTYALFQVRSASGSIAGSLQFQGAGQNPGALAPHLTYGVRTIPGGSSCTEATFTASQAIVVPTGSPLGAASTTTQSVTANAGSTVNYCLRLAMPSDASNAAQGLVGNPRWVVQGTSASG